MAWPAEDGSLLADGLLEQALRVHDSDMVAAAMVIGFSFGFAADSVAHLNALATVDWHQSHEDITRALGDLADARSVEALGFLTRWTPEYLRQDPSRTLAVNAIHALDGINDPAAQAALRGLLASSDANILRGLRDINILEDPEDVAFVYELAESTDPAAKDALDRLRTSSALGIRRAFRELGLYSDHRE